MILKRCFAAVGSVSVITLGLGCADSSHPAVQSPREVALAQLDTAGSDLMAFAQRQRMFVQAMTTGNPDEIARLVRMDFTVYNAAPTQMVRPGPLASFPNAFVTHTSFTADYVRALRDRLQLPYSEQSTYRLYRGRTHATVITNPTTGGTYLTGWDSTSVGWRVTSVTINLSAEHLATVEKALKEDPRRPIR